MWQQTGEHQRLLQCLHFRVQGTTGTLGLRRKTVMDPIDRELTFDQGQFVLIRAIQELRSRNPSSPLLVGIGGPSGSGKSSLAGRLANVLEGVVMDQCNYNDPRLVKDDLYDLRALDIRLLLQHLQDLLRGKEVRMPLFDSDTKERSGFKLVQVPESGVVIVKGVFALHGELKDLLDIRVAVVGGVHYNLLQKVKADVQQSGVSMKMADVMDSVFPTFRTDIEPTLTCAQVRISNCFVADSLRRPLYILKCKAKMSVQTVLAALRKQQDQSEWTTTRSECLDVYLCPPGLDPSERKTTSWIRVRQIGIRYFLSVGDQRLVERNFAIRPRAEFEVGKMTLTGLLQCSYSVAASFSCESTLLEQPGGRAAISLDRLKMEDTWQHEDFIQVKGVDRQVVSDLASAVGLTPPWVTQSYVEIVLDRVGVVRSASPPLASSWLRLSGYTDTPLPTTPLQPPQSEETDTPHLTTQAPPPPPPASGNGSQRRSAMRAAMDSLFQLASPTRPPVIASPNRPQVLDSSGRTPMLGSSGRTQVLGSSGRHQVHPEQQSPAGAVGVPEVAAGGAARDDDAPSASASDQGLEASAFGVGVNVRGGSVLGSGEGDGGGGEGEGALLDVQRRRHFAVEEEDGQRGRRMGGEEEEVPSWTHSPTRSMESMPPASWRLTGLDEAMLMRTQFIEERIALPEAQAGGGAGAGVGGGASFMASSVASGLEASVPQAASLLHERGPAGTDSQERVESGEEAGESHQGTASSEAKEHQHHPLLEADTSPPSSTLPLGDTASPVGGHTGEVSLGTTAGEVLSGAVPLTPTTGHQRVFYLSAQVQGGQEAEREGEREGEAAAGQEGGRERGREGEAAAEAAAAAAVSAVPAGHLPDVTSSPGLTLSQGGAPFPGSATSPSSSFSLQPSASSSWPQQPWGGGTAGMLEGNSEGRVVADGRQEGTRGGGEGSAVAEGGRVGTGAGQVGGAVLEGRRERRREDEAVDEGFRREQEQGKSAEGTRKRVGGGVRFKLVPKRENFGFDRGMVLGIQAAQKLLAHNGPPVIIGIGGPSGSGKSSLAKGMSQVMGCQVLTMDSYILPSSGSFLKAASPGDEAALHRPRLPSVSNNDRASALDWELLLKNLSEIKANGSAQVPVFEHSRQARIGYCHLTLPPDNAIVILEGSHALHPSLQPFLDLGIAVSGGVHAHLISRVAQDYSEQRASDQGASEKGASGQGASGQGVSGVGSIPRSQLEQSIFPTFFTEIKPYMADAHLKVYNDFDPVLSRETSAFVLKSNKEVSDASIRSILNPSQYTFCQQSFTDIFLRLPPSQPTSASAAASVSTSAAAAAPGPVSEGDCIRVRMCEHRFAILIREPLCEGDFVLQPQVDFDIGVETLKGLLELGYEPVLYLEVIAILHQDDDLLVEVDHLTTLNRRFVQIKGRSKERVASAGAALSLSGHYTTQPYMEIAAACSADDDSARVWLTAKHRLQELLTQFSPQLGSGSDSPARSGRQQERQEHRTREGASSSTESASARDSSGALSGTPDIQKQLLHRLEMLDARLARMEHLQFLNTIILVTFIVWYAIRSGKSG